MKNWFLRLFVLEMAVAISVVFVFRLIESRQAAGLVAGSLFIAVGISVLIAGLTDGEFRKSMTFVLGCVHLFVAALPMVIFRLLNWGEEFASIQVWGLPGPVFHGISQVIYVGMIVSTVIEGLWRTRMGKRVQG
jgi:hypothetical protein